MKELTYEQAEERLVEICEKLENEKLTISETTTLYEESSKLLKFCLNELQIKKGKITQIKETLEGAIETDF